MKHCVSYFLGSVLLVAATAGSAAAQELVNIRIFTEPSGARFMVDGQQYVAAQAFVWPRGSKHVVTVLTSNFTNDTGGTICEEGGSTSQIQYDPQCRTRFNFGGWQTDGGALASAGLLSQNITAERSMTYLKATFSVEYRIDVAFFSGGGGQGPTAFCRDKATRAYDPIHPGDGVGVVFVGGACFDYSGFAWLAPGEITLEASPFQGYVFGGWYLDGAPPQGSIARYVVRGPAVLTPRFIQAKRVYLYTDPLELRVRVDRTDILTINPKSWTDVVRVPGRYDFAPGSRHVLGAPSPQTDQINTGKMWVFQSWSNGGGQDMVYTADEEVGKSDILVAKFVPGVSVTFLTEPRGLRLNIDGRENWPAYGFVWGLGSKYTFSAPLEQVDSKGRKWSFKGWKHGGPATQEVAIDDQAIASGGVYYTAMYEALPQVVIQTSLPGLKIKIDGADCISPCRVDKPMGTNLRVSVPAVIPQSEVTRQEFTGWNDGAGADRVITITQDTQVFQASYQQSHRLFTIVDPPDGGSIRTEPGSVDGFYVDGSEVGVAIEAKAGFRFRRWEGDIAGTARTGSVFMSGSRMVTALLDRVPYLPPASVRNAAGRTPVDGVAPGSLISIAGANLTTTSEAGPASPLAQTLGGVVVLLSDRILPLVFVSPEQINALLPSDLDPGRYKLTVRPQSGPDVTSEFEVVRNAPGLFATQVDSVSYASALHEDGSAITTASRARRNETITILGTGFGPYNRPVVDGFAVPASPQYALLDSVDLTVGGLAVRPVFAGAAPGFVGLVGVRFRVPAEATGDREVRVTAGGAESNTVILPIE